MTPTSTGDLRPVYLFDILEPVSYTHLDVYKRQDQERSKENTLLRVIS